MTAHSKLLATLALILSATALTAAQDPLRTLPNSYKLQLENDYVKVVKVHYDAGAKLPTHTHPAGQTAYVYLNDSDGIIYRHTSGRGHVVNRAPVKMGAVRFTTDQDENHEVENTSSTAAEFLRIMIKTETLGASGRRLQPTDLQYENQQLRVTRSQLPQHETLTVDAKEPALIIELPSGETHWVDAGKSATIENHEVPVLSLMRFDFLTKPK